jgi:omega-6 fatty acid desaturase (delta-12 desaturase)
MLKTPTFNASTVREQANEAADELRDALKNWVQIVRKYQTPSTGRAVWQLANTFLPFIGLWVLMYLSLDYSYWLTWGLGVLNAFFLVRIFIIQHDCGHQSFLRSRTWNNILGFFCSLVSLIPYKYWAKSHSFHHAHNGQLDHRDIGDITTLTVKEYMALSWWGRMNYRIYRSPLVMFGLGPLYYVLLHNRLALFKPTKWDKAKVSLIWSTLAVVGVYVSLCWLLGWKEFFMVQIPILTVFATTAIWFFYVQHQHEHTYKEWKDSWDYLTAAIKGSSYYKLPGLVHWLTGNIGYHHIHHLSSLIPSYNLPECHRENPILTKYANALTFGESLKCMFNKLWDEERGRMITFGEFKRLERRMREHFGK